jgi:AraC-like DNA-binding protein
LPEVDETLRTVATSYLDHHFPSPTTSTADIVRAALAQSVGTSGSAITDIAELLALHPRTLQRRLAHEGTTFAHLRDESLKHLAYQYITETTMPMARIATVLGLAEQSVLTTACRRWFGLTPTELRRRGT